MKPATAPSYTRRILFLLSHLFAIFAEMLATARRPANAGFLEQGEWL